jgi:adenylate cyclase
VPLYLPKLPKLLQPVKRTVPHPFRHVSFLDMPQRRTVTVMFTDIIGFSTLMGRDERATIKLLQDHAIALEPCVRDHDGQLAKRIGDGYMVWFHSALDALDCAFSMQTEIAKVRKRLPLRIRIGLNCGDVSFGEDNDLFGNTVNMAKRLEAHAREDGICVSESVRQNISPSDRRAFDFEDAGALELKGAPELLRAWHVTRAGENDNDDEAQSEPPKKSHRPGLSFDFGL